jgi:hypothetical protein
MGGTEPAGEYTFFYELGIDFFVYKRIISGVQRTKFVCDRMSCITLRGSLCDIVLMFMPQQRIKFMIQRTGSTKN